MNRDTIYWIREGSAEYPIYLCAMWIRAHDLGGFHLMKTLETSPRVLSLFHQSIRPATGDEIKRWQKQHPSA